jgi:hypothetical protein
MPTSQYASGVQYVLTVWNPAKVTAYRQFEVESTRIRCVCEAFSERRTVLVHRNTTIRHHLWLLDCVFKRKEENATSLDKCFNVRVRPDRIRSCLGARGNEHHALASLEVPKLTSE